MEETATGVDCYDPPEEFISLDPYFNYVVNIGSVGQPKDGDPHTCYMLYDTDRAAIRYRRVKYDVWQAQMRFKSVQIHGTSVARIAMRE